MQDSLKIGPLLATLLVAGNMIGAGVYLLPASLAPFGTSSLMGWLAAAGGAIALAGVFAILGRLRPDADGLLDYPRIALHPFLGFVAWIAYWVGCPLSNVAIALAAVGYLASLFPALSGAVPTLIALLGVIWLFVLINLAGARTVTGLGGAALALGLLPVLSAIVLGLAAFDPALFAAAWSPEGKSLSQTVPGVVLLVFWAFTGLECANAISAKVRNPARDLPIAALGGVLLAGTIYILACVAVQGVIPPAELARSTAPFADVVTRLAGPIAGTLVAIFAIIKAFGTLGGWILVTVETARAGALAGYFPRFLTEADPAVTPRRGLLFSGILMSVIAVTTVAPTLAKQFNALISLTVATTMMTYGLCCIALVILARSIAAPGRRLAAQALGLAALAFSLWVIWTWIASL